MLCLKLLCLIRMPGITIRLGERPGTASEKSLCPSSNPWLELCCGGGGESDGLINHELEFKQQCLGLRWGSGEVIRSIPPRKSCYTLYICGMHGTSTQPFPRIDRLTFRWAGSPIQVYHTLPVHYELA